MAEEKPKENTEHSHRVTKNQLIVVIILAVLALGALFLTLSIRSNDSDDDNQNEQQTFQDIPDEVRFADEIKKIQAPDDATKEEEDITNITIAWAQYEAGRYQETLDILDNINNPSDNSQLSMDQLYGLTYTAMGNFEAAIPFHQKTLDDSEENLIKGAKKDFGSACTLADLYYLVRDLDNAKTYYQRCIDLINEIDEENFLGEEVDTIQHASQRLEEIG